MIYHISWARHLELSREKRFELSACDLRNGRVKFMLMSVIKGDSSRSIKKRGVRYTGMESMSKNWIETEHAKLRKWQGRLCHLSQLSFIDPPLRTLWRRLFLRWRERDEKYQRPLYWPVLNASWNSVSNVFMVRIFAWVLLTSWTRN